MFLKGVIARKVFLSLLSSSKKFILRSEYVGGFFLRAVIIV